MKISNELISFVFGCECEFKLVDNNTIFLYSEEKIKNTDWVAIWDNKGNESVINIYEFIHLAKAKCLEVGYEVIELSRRTKVFNYDGKLSKSICYVGPNEFDTSKTLECLEWVCGEIGRDNG